MNALLDRRLVFVTGKGGVGKSTIAAALGLVAARQGRRVMVAELAGRGDAARALGGHARGWDEVEHAPGVFGISIDAQAAVREYLADQLPSRTLADLLASSRAFSHLAAAAPGLAELVLAGKLWELSLPVRRVRGARAYDLVVVDAPATGHGVALLRSPRTLAGIAATGPVHRQAGTIADALQDRDHTAVLAVTTPEEMPVNETVGLRDALAPEWDLEAVVVNGVRTQRFSAAEAGALAGRADDPAVRAALDAHGIAREQAAQLGRLRRRVEAPVLRLPHAPDVEAGGADVEVLADRLERSLAGAGLEAA